MAATVGAAAARRSGEPEFVMGGSGAPAKRARRGAGAPLETAGLEPRPRRYYTSFGLLETHGAALERHAWARKQAGITGKFDMSGVLRDVLDFWQAHEEEVGLWIAKQRNRPAQGKR